MLKWKRISSGEYEDEKKRFLIRKTYDRVYGDHWVLHDTNVADYYKRQYHENTLLACKLIAENITDREKRERKE